MSGDVLKRKKKHHLRFRHSKSLKRSCIRQPGTKRELAGAWTFRWLLHRCWVFRWTPMSLSADIPWRHTESQWDVFLQLNTVDSIESELNSVTLRMPWSVEVLLLFTFPQHVHGNEVFVNSDVSQFFCLIICSIHPFSVSLPLCSRIERT